MVDPAERGRLMVDPSVLGSAAGLEWFLTIPEPAALVFPAAFVTAIREGLNRQSRSFFGLKTLVQPEYEGAWQGATERLASVAAFEIPQDRLGDEAEEIRASLRQGFPHPLNEILAEEWTFLTSQSWIGSRLVRPFSTFFRHGATFIQVGWRRIATRTLRLPRELSDQPLTGRQHARAVFKWVAAGGADAFALLGMQGRPLSALGLLGSFFVLIDP